LDFSPGGDFWGARGLDDLGCDLIVCWKHNWPECPIEVLELEKVVMSLPMRAGSANGYTTLPTAMEGQNESGD
jgi:hypothetical protein